MNLLNVLLMMIVLVILSLETTFVLRMEMLLKTLLILHAQIQEQ